MRRPPFATLGGAGVVLECAAMVSMLPAGAAGVLGAIGLTGSSALARALSPVAEPLFLASGALVILGSLACSRLVVVLSGAGTALYLSMFRLVTGGTSDAASMSTMSMDPSHHAPSAVHADPATFYLGLALLVGAAALAAWRRHRHACRPLVRFPPLRAARR